MLLSRRCCNGTFSLLPARSTSPHSTRDEPSRTLHFTRGFAVAPTLRPLRKGGLGGESSHWRCATSARPPPPPPSNFGGGDSSGYLSRQFQLPVLFLLRFFFFFLLAQVIGLVPRWSLIEIKSIKNLTLLFAILHLW